MAVVVVVDSGKCKYQMANAFYRCIYTVTSNKTLTI